MTLCDLCERHGLEVAPEKNVWPTKVKEYVGLEIDSSAQKVRVGEKRAKKMMLTNDQAPTHAHAHASTRKSR